MRAWLARRRKRRNCFHHDRLTGASWIQSRHLDYGRKLYWCTTCERTWIP